MTVEGRLMRGKDNYDRGRFLNNSETLEYVATLPKKETPKKEDKKNVKSN